MTIALRALIAVVAALPIASLASAPSQGAAQRRVEFAVIPAAGSSTDWLLQGVAFDLEKRLGRLPSLEPADRLEVADALKDAAPGDASRARVVMGKTGARFVLCVGAASDGNDVSLGVDLWIGKQPAFPFAARGSRENLFRLVDKLTDCLIAELAKAGIDAGKHEDSPKLWPARSATAYESLIKGMLAVQGGDVAQAKAQLTKTLAIDRDNWFARYFLGAVALREGDIAKAAQYCREAIALNPDVYAGVYANLSYCCAAMGDDKQAAWAKNEFERRAGKLLPPRTVPGGMPQFGARP
jgi:tetratricopeptide (TPR) repeat protein